MNKAVILDRLEMLVTLCEKTEPDIPSDRYLFTQHSISVQDMMKEVRDLHTGRHNRSEDSERKLLINIMRQSNKIWRTRNKVKNGEWDDLSRAVIEEEIEDFLADNQKINAIKYYRSEMKDKYDIEMGLREAKDYIDNIHDDMKRRGMIIK